MFNTRQIENLFFKDFWFLLFLVIRNSHIFKTMCRIERSTKFRLQVLIIFICVIAETVALAYHNNHICNHLLWNWSVAVTIQQYIILISMLKRRDDPKINLMEGIFAYIVWFFPTIVRSILAIITVANNTCRQEWNEKNPIMLYYSLLYFVFFVYDSIATLFHQNCVLTPDNDNAQHAQDDQNNQIPNFIDNENPIEGQ